LLLNECSELTVCIAKEMMNMNLRDGKNLTTWYNCLYCWNQRPLYGTVCTVVFKMIVSQHQEMVYDMYDTISYCKENCTANTLSAIYSTVQAYHTVHTTYHTKRPEYLCTALIAIIIRLYVQAIIYPILSLLSAVPVLYSQLSWDTGTACCSQQSIK
jgi:hypothetical protein